MKIKIGDFFKKDRIRSVSIWILRVLYNKIANRLSKLDTENNNKLGVGSTLVVTEEIKNKLGRVDDFEQIHIIEQYMYRFLSCPQCVSEGECVHCGCKIPARMFVRTDKCSMDYWPPFKDKELWEKYKKNLGFEIKLIYKTVK